MWRARCSLGGDGMERGNTNIALPATKPNEHGGPLSHCPIIDRTLRKVF